MAILTGTIQEIQDVSFGKRKKNLLTIKSTVGGLAFLEFRNELKTISDRFQKEDVVTVEYYHQGKTSPSTGFKYNNLIAESISKV